MTNPSKDKKITLEIKKREKIGKKVSKRLHKEGKIAAVVYGKGQEPIAIEMNEKKFITLENKVSENAILTLVLPDKTEIQSIVHAIDKDPVRNYIVHVDFLKIDPKRKIETHVPIKFIGTSLAVKEKGAVLVKNFDHLTISCLPTEIPDFLKAYLKQIKDVNDYIKVSDIQIEENIEVIEKPDTVVAIATIQKEEEEKPVTTTVEGEATEEGAEAAPEGEAKEGEGKPDEEKKEGEPKKEDGAGKPSEKEQK